jgi:xanthine dehydrogenase YagR molybdenum-binding subunit
MATAAYPGLRWKQSATVKLLADGTAIGRTASHEIGNGAKTVLARVLASGLGLPPDKVTVELGDSAFPFAPAAGGSQTTASGGAALLAAAAAAVAKLAAVAVADETSPLAGLKADAVAVRDGRLVADAGKGEPIAAALRRAGLKEVEAEATSEPGPEAKKFGFLSTGAVFVEVRVDADFGTVRVSRVVGVYDCGRTLNPKSAHSQLVGGVVMGLGAALSEATHYDPRRGQPVNPDLGDYLVPVAADTPPHLNLSFVDEPDPNLAPHGGRGVGEIGVTGIQAAVANAVYHATGVRVRELPVTADRLLTDPSFLGGRK